MRARRVQRPREPAIALINIVFLMLIFFLVAGTLAPPLGADLKLVQTADLSGNVPEDALVVHADGAVTHRGEPAGSIDAYVAALTPEARAVVRVVPDRDLPAADLVALGRGLQEAGAGRVVIVTERALK